MFIACRYKVCKWGNGPKLPMDTNDDIRCHMVFLVLLVHFIASVIILGVHEREREREVHNGIKLSQETISKESY